MKNALIDYPETVQVILQCLEESRDYMDMAADVSKRKRAATKIKKLRMLMDEPQLQHLTVIQLAKKDIDEGRIDKAKARLFFNSIH